MREAWTEFSAPSFGLNGPVDGNLLYLINLGEKNENSEVLFLAIILLIWFHSERG